MTLRGGQFSGQAYDTWLKAQSEILFHLWHRPSGITTFIVPIQSIPQQGPKPSSTEVPPHRSM